MTKPELHDVQVEVELLQKKFKCVCSWHFKNFGYELVMREGEDLSGPVTSSICEQCREILRPERTHVPTEPIRLAPEQEACPHVGDLQWVGLEGVFRCKDCGAQIVAPELSESIGLDVAF